MSRERDVAARGERNHGRDSPSDSCSRECRLRSVCRPPRWASGTVQRFPAPPPPHRTAQNPSFVFWLLGFVPAMSAFFCGVSFFLGRLLGSSRGAMLVSEGHGPPQMLHFAVGSHCENLAACRRHEKTPSEGPHRGKHTCRRPNKNGIVGSSLPRPHSTTRGVLVAPSDAEGTLLGMPAFYDILSMELLALIPTGGPKEVKAVSHKLDVLKKR